MFFSSLCLVTLVYSCVKILLDKSSDLRHGSISSGSLRLSSSLAENDGPLDMKGMSPVGFSSLRSRCTNCVRHFSVSSRLLTPASESLRPCRFKLLRVGASFRTRDTSVT